MVAKKARNPACNKGARSTSSCVADTTYRLHDLKLDLRSNEIMLFWGRLLVQESDEWTTFNTKSMLRGALLGQKKYSVADPLLLNVPWRRHSLQPP